MGNQEYIRLINPRFVRYNVAKGMYMLACYDPASYREVIYLYITDIMTSASDTSVHDLIEGYKSLSTDVNAQADFIFTGTGKLALGTNYFISRSLYDRFIGDGAVKNPNRISYGQSGQSGTIPSYVISDFMGQDGFMSAYFDSLSSLKCKDSDNMTYFIRENLIYAGYTFTRAELETPIQTFFGQIRKLHGDVPLTEIRNSKYSSVISYFADGGTDCASALISLFLTASSDETDCACTQYNYKQTTGSGSCSACSADDSDGSSNTCLTAYNTAMETMMKTMLGDLNFYCDWLTEDDGTGTRTANTALISALEEFIDEFEGAGIAIPSDSDGDLCVCGRIDTSVTPCSYTMLDNFKKVLEWVKEGKMQNNRNKTYVYGRQFADVLLKFI